MIVPIIMPMGHSDPPKCPKCGRKENIKEVCRHCGYEYEPTRWYNILIIIGTIVFCLWVLVTVIFWLADSGIYHYPKRDSYTLWEIIKLQWEWIKSLKVW